MPILGGDASHFASELLVQETEVDWAVRERVRLRVEGEPVLALVGADALAKNEKTSQAQ